MADNFLDTLYASLHNAPPEQAPSTDVAGVTVNATPPPSRQAPLDVAPTPDPQLLPNQVPNIQAGPHVNPYDNSDAVHDLQASVAALHPEGGSPNPGLYGLLPQNLQHGTMRNVLGALGDAFLVGSGHDATYGPRMDRQRQGLALAGADPNDPSSIFNAAARVAATGGVGSMASADGIIQSAQRAATQRDALENTRIYRDQVLDQRRNNLYARMAPLAAADLARATSAADYAQRASMWQTRLHGIDPSADLEGSLGIPSAYGQSGLDPMSGLTANQGFVHDDRIRGQDLTHNDRVRGQDISSTDRGLQRDTSERNTDVNANSRVTSAGISANRPSQAQFNAQYIARRRAGEQTTPEEDALYNHNTHVTQPRGRHGSTTTTTTAPPPSGHPIPTPADLLYLARHPEYAPRFQAHFGYHP